MRVFVSYSGHDREQVDSLRKILERAGCDVSLDLFDLPPRPSVLDDARRSAVRGALEREIERSDHVVVILSPTALASPWVAVELEAAKALHRPTTFVRVRACPGDARLAEQAVVSAEWGLESERVGDEILEHVLAHAPDPARRLLLADREENERQLAVAAFERDLPVLRESLVRLSREPLRELGVVLPLAAVPAPGTELVLRLDFGNLERSAIEITLEKWTDAGASAAQAALDFTELRPERPMIVASLRCGGERRVQAPDVDGTDFGDRPLEYTFDLGDLHLPLLSAVLASASCSLDVIRQDPTDESAPSSELAVKLTTYVRTGEHDETIVLFQGRLDARAQALIDCPALVASASTLERFALVGICNRPNGEQAVGRAAREQLELVAEQASQALAAGERPIMGDDWDRRFVARFIAARAARHVLRGALNDAFRCFGDAIEIIAPVARKSVDLVDVVLLLTATHGQCELLFKAGRNDDALVMVEQMRSILAAAELNHPGNPFLAVWRARAHVIRAQAARDVETQAAAAQDARAVVNALVAKRDTPQRRHLRDSVESALEGSRKRRRPRIPI